MDVLTGAAGIEQAIAMGGYVCEGRKTISQFKHSIIFCSIKNFYANNLIILVRDRNPNMEQAIK